jgi:hypothetical protein
MDEKKPNYILLAALIGACATIIAAIIAVYGGIKQASLPIEATQTAEAIRTSMAIAFQTTNAIENSSTQASTIVSPPPTETVSTAFPTTPRISSPPTEIYFGEWVIVIGKFPSLENAKSYIVPFTDKGFPVQIFCRISETDPSQTPEIRAAVIGFQSEELVNTTLPQVQVLNPSAYSRQFPVWCKNPNRQGDYISCNYVSCQ